MKKITLPARQSFSLVSTVQSHGWAQLVPFQFDAETKRLIYIIRLESGKVVELCMAASNVGLDVELSAGLTRREIGEIRRSVNWMIALDQDLSAFYKIARSEPKLAHVERRAQGRVLRSPTLFEDVVKTILTTNTLWKATKRMNGNLVAQFGDPLPGDSQRRAFPSPDALARTTVEVLRSETRLGYRAPYIHELAANVASGRLDLEAYKTCDLPTSDLRKQLLKIKGVGAYAAANLLMILGRFDFIPIDSWAYKLVSHEWYNAEAITAAEIEAAFEKWGQWKGLAYWFWDWSYKG